MAVVGNKQDLVALETVDPIEARDWARDIGGCFFKTSAKDNLGVDQLFNSLSEQLLLQAHSSPSNIRLDESALQPLRKGRCCHT